MLFLMVFFLLAFTIVDGSDKSSFSAPPASPSFVVESVAPTDQIPDDLADKLRQVSSDIRDNRLSSALARLQDMVTLLQEKQKAGVSRFFPDTFESFQRSANKAPPGDFLGDSTSYGVLLSMQYRRPNGQMIDISVVFSDPSIQEYLNLVSNPALLQSFDHTQLIQVHNGQFPALEKYAESGRYCERNIVVNDMLLVNVIAVGLPDRKVLDRFLDQINLTGLATYLTQ